ncbi:3-oxo-tetronate kinase [Vannielia litorea]|uniref:3-oxo-tetronate kinase n=1 Tax=Vannielia litorea TaxID=1217970 RepID=UPI0021BD3281|nr:3-oxo-tetronate kinase [Vannielia litorea]
MGITIGAIADDFTGATDLASTLAREGMSVVQVIGVPDAATETHGAEAVVVALKSRTAPKAEAVGEAIAATDWLLPQGAGQILFKYCSTFDSTDEGNIGPVADALLEHLGEGFAVICPAFPDNGRTVSNGELFVGDVPLAESSMKDHPLTPMRDSNLIRLMERQSRHRAGLISLDDVRSGLETIGARVEALRAEGRRYGVVDAVTNADLRAIGAANGSHRFITGGSGISLGLPAYHRATGALGEAVPLEMPSVTGRALVLSGSCSEATRAQVARACSVWPSRKVDISHAAEGDGEAEALVAWALGQPANAPVLIYGSSDPAEVARTQAALGRVRAGEVMERTLATVARALLAEGFTRIVVAGGETSGAVVTALGVKALRIGPQIAPGVPWTETLGTAPAALALKSGNFGGETFFEDALGMLP